MDIDKSFLVGLAVINFHIVFVFVLVYVYKELVPTNLQTTSTL